MGGGPRLHPTKGASAVLRDSGCRGPCQGPRRLPGVKKVSLLLHTQSDPAPSALLRPTPILTRRTQPARVPPGVGPRRTEGVPEGRDGSLKGGGLPLEGRGGAGRRRELEGRGASWRLEGAVQRAEGPPGGVKVAPEDRVLEGGATRGVQGDPRVWRGPPDGRGLGPRVDEALGAEGVLRGRSLGPGPQETPQGQVGQ